MLVAQLCPTLCNPGLPWWLSWKRIRLQCRRPGFDPSVGKVPWRREWLPTPVFWPGEFHGLHSPWGHKESDMNEWLSLCNPMDYNLPWTPLSMGFPREEYWSGLPFRQGKVFIFSSPSLLHINLEQLSHLCFSFQENRVFIHHLTGSV